MIHEVSLQQVRQSYSVYQTQQREEKESTIPNRPSLSDTRKIFINAENEINEERSDEDTTCMSDL